MEYTTALIEEIAEQIGQKMAARCGSDAAEDMAELEEGVSAILKQVGRACMEALLAERAVSYPPEQVPCGCGEQATYQYRRQGTVVTQFGQVKYRRAYYVCEHCRCGQYPLDRQLGIVPGQVSPTLGSKLAMLGVQTAFGAASRLAAELLLLPVSPTTVHKETLRFGALQEEREEEEKAQSQDPDHLLARERQVVQRPARLYGSLDEGMTPVDEEWRGLKVGCWYEVERVSSPAGQTRAGADPAEDPTFRATAISYYCDFADPHAFGDLVWATGCQRAADLAQELVFVADGAQWIWKLVEHHFPQAIQIVDWYHAVAYLSPVAQAAFPEPKLAQAWHARVKELLWQGKVNQVINECERLRNRFPSAAAPAQSAITYFANNAHRMDYARFRQEGYLIGSGTVESACKQICTHRLKRAGARWSQEGARKTAKARAAWLSHDWHELARRRAQLDQAA